MSLKRKHNNAQSSWEDGYNRSTDLYSESHMRSRMLQAAERIASHPVDVDKMFYGWSGGKDSVVLQRVCEIAGVKKSVLGICDRQFEFPAMHDFCIENKPPMCDVYTAAISYDFLENNPKYLFPYKYRDRRALHPRLVIHASWEYCRKKNGCETLLLGHRVKDGNICGDNGLYMGRTGLTKLCPIYDFTHEEVFAAIKYFNLPLAPIYSMPDGYNMGTGPWVYVKPKDEESKDSAMDLVASIDVSVLQNSAPHLSVIREYCDRKGIAY